MSLRYLANLCSSLSLSRLKWAFRKGRIWKMEAHTIRESIQDCIEFNSSSHLQAILRIHQEVPPQIIEHDSVSLIPLREFSPQHPKRLHLKYKRRNYWSHDCWWKDWTTGTGSSYRIIMRTHGSHQENMWATYASTAGLIIDTSTI